MKFCLAIILLFITTGIAYAQKDQLPFYLDQARVNSPLLKDYQNQIRSAYYDSLLIRAAYLPQVSGSSINRYSPNYQGWGYDAVITNGANFTALVGVNKQLMNSKVVAAQFQGLQLQNQSLDNSSKITEQDLKRAVIAQYIAAWGDLQQLQVNQEIDELLNREEAILKKLTQQNVYKQVDYLAFLVTLQQQALLVKQQQIQYRSDYALLNYISGTFDTAYTTLQKPVIEQGQLPDISRSVFFKQFELDSLKYINSKTQVSMSYKPKINLYADAGFNSSLAYAIYKNFGTNVGFSVVVPIYDGKQKQMQYHKIELAEKTRENNRAFFSSQYRQQIAQLKQQLGATEELISNIDAQLKYTQRLIEVNGQLLQVGEVRITDYILAMNNYISIKNLVLQNKTSRLQLINQLNYWNR